MDPLLEHRSTTQVRLFAFIALAALGISGAIYSAKQHTPKSISVSGYTRQDGTRVSAYRRRPAGSVKKDAPWGILMLLSGGAGAFGTICSFAEAKELIETNEQIRNR